MDTLIVVFTYLLSCHVVLCVFLYRLACIKTISQSGTLVGLINGYELLCY